MKRLLLAACAALALAQVCGASEAVPEGQPADTIARVGGDQFIRFAELNTLLNSSPIVGLSIPALGTPERNQVIVALLDKVISADLLYLDAIKLGKDQDPSYLSDMKSFSDAIMAGLYRARYLVGEVDVTAEEVDRFYRDRINPGTEMTEQLQAGIEATIRKEKFKRRTAGMRERLREGVQVEVDVTRLDPADDALRADDEVVARYGGTDVTWGEVKARFSPADSTLAPERRVAVVDDWIDQALMVRKGREAGLEQDPVYRARVGEFRKSRLVNLHREQLFRDMEPDEAQLRDFYQQNQARIATKDRRKIQMVVLKTRGEAESVKQKIDGGEISIFQAAAEYSIHPDAKRTLGDFGWVTKGSGFPGLDELAFSLELDQLGGPVESPAGWHLVKVVDEVPGKFTDIEQPETRKATRRLYLKEKLNAYVVDLRLNDFPVVVYEDNLKRLFREEAQWIAAKTKEMEQHPERAQEILDRMRKVVE